MNIRTLIGAAALLLCSSLVTADTTSVEGASATTTGDDPPTTVTSSNSREGLDVTPEISTNYETVTETPTFNSLSNPSSVHSTQVTPAPVPLSESSTSTETSNNASSPASVPSSSLAPTAPHTDAPAPSVPDTKSSSSSLLSTTSPEVLPTTDSPSPTTSTETPLEITVAGEPTTTSSLQTSGVDEWTTGGSSISSRSNTISKTPVVPQTDAAASSTTLEDTQHIMNNIGSTEGSQKPSEESTSSDLTEYLNQNETETSEEMSKVTQNDTVTTMPTGEGSTHETSTEVTESPDECNVARQERNETEETVRHYYLVTVILVLVMNLGFCLVTVFCVHRITKHYNTRSWDPPPIRYGSVDYGISLGRRNMGLDLSPEIPAGIPPPPRATRERSDSIPILITNEDGWCVPYNDDVHTKSQTHPDEDNNQPLSTIGDGHHASDPEELSGHSDTGL